MIKIDMRRGFTLIEILIVVGILAILGVTAAIGLNPIQQLMKGNDTRRKADIANIKAAFENYYEDRGCYPTLPMMTKVAAGAFDGYLTYTCGDDTLAPYIDSMPCDPNTKQPYNIFISQSTVTCPQEYVLYTTLSNIFDPSGKEIVNCDGKFVTGSNSASETLLRQGCSHQVPNCPYAGIWQNGVCVTVTNTYNNICTKTGIARCWNNSAACRGIGCCNIGDQTDCTW